MPKFFQQSPKSEIKRSVGRPVNEDIDKTFNEACMWLETCTGTVTMKEIHDQMKATCSLKWLRKRLLAMYGKSLSVTSDRHRYYDMAEHIINDKWYYAAREKNICDEKQRVVLAAAKLIKDEIRGMNNHTMNVYPTDESMANEDEGQRWLPKGLLLLLNTIMPSKRKVSSIRQCIVYAARPQYAIPPVVFGLGVQLDHMFGSRWLVNQLYRLGFSISHEEVNRYKQSVLQIEQVEERILTNASGFIQWSADNVDHNTVTLDGKNTFHGMGIIASTTSTADNLVPHLEPVSRRKRIPVQELIKDKGIPIVPFIGPARPSICNYVYKPRKELTNPYTLPSDINCDVLWHTGWLFESGESKHPNWSGFMQNKGSDIIAE